MIIIFTPLHILKDFKKYNVAHLEIVNVVVAVKIWGYAWAYKPI